LGRTGDKWSTGLVAEAAVAYYLTLHVRVALRHSRIIRRGGIRALTRSGLATDAMTQFVRRGLPSAAVEMAQAEIASERTVRPRLAGDDGNKRRNGEGNQNGNQNGPGTAVITKTKPQTKRPNLYRVLLLNDDYTPMEFVVHVLERFFNKDREAATRIMLHVHHHGIGECGIFTYEIAETKVTQVMDFARKHQHPLQCVMEKK
jgi:ATP-dependent Clp protease adaptor protein ClpS